MNFYKHHIGDYAQATAHLSFIEDAAYCRLIRKYYAEEKPLPPDIKTVQRLVGARSKEERNAVESVLREFFFLTDEGWRNKRCDIEIDKAVAQATANQKVAREREAKRKNRSETSVTVDAGARIEHDSLNDSLTLDERYVHGLTNESSTALTTNRARFVHDSSDDSLRSREPSQTPDSRLQTYSDAYASGSADAPPGVCSPGEVIFGIGVPLLVASGASEKHARSFLGALRKQHGDTVLAAKISECAQSRPLQPMEWLAASLPLAGAPPPGASPPHRGNGYLSIPDPSKIDYRASVEREVDANGNRKFA